VTTEPVKLLFGVHAHQPAGNFPRVVREAHERCYRPFFEALDRHPDFPFAMHVSGWLLEFLMREYPDDMRRVRAMVQRGQIEIFGGGDTEPVLAAIPEVDRREQIAALNRRIRRRFGVRARGAWLTERVWEATVVPSLASTGMRYVVVDDYHFLCAGIASDRLDGYYRTEENGAALDLLPISEALRYRIPFAPVADTVAYLEQLAPAGAAIYFDDIEKFGIWPQTHDWVYGRRWLEDFLEAVAASPKLVPMRYADYHAAHAPRGVVYLPSVSYIEMSEWTLPAGGARRLDELVGRARSENSFDRDKVYLRGGQWRNFFTKYPESNWMHKRVLHASARYHRLPARDRTTHMQADLHLCQANDAYWHGLFGGIYHPHLRRQVYAALARLESAVDARLGREACEPADLEFDGDPAWLLWSPELLAAVKPSAGASVRELTDYRLAHNFADVLARREEWYFDKIRERGPSERPRDGGIASIHDRIAYRTEIVDADLEADREPRGMFVDRWRPDGSEQSLVRYARAEDGKPARLAFRSEHAGLWVTKTIGLRSGSLAVSYVLQPTVAGMFSVMLDIAMPSCDGPGGSYEADGTVAGGFGEVLDVAQCAELRLVDSELGGSARLRFDPPAAISAMPMCTVSQSEAGFEKIMQAATVCAQWRVDGPTRVDLLFTSGRKRS
jgi:4-alpha-glucanotransferase